MVELLLNAVPALLEGGFLACIVELLVNYHSQKIKEEVRRREDLIDDRLDRIEKDITRLEEGRKWEFQVLNHEIKQLNDCKVTRPPRD